MEIENKLVCKECGKEFKNRAGLSQHIRYDHKIKVNDYYGPRIFKNKMKCEICGKECENKLGLSSHKSSLHKIRSFSYHKPQKNKNIKCEICEEKFESFHSLSIHIGSSHKDKITVKDYYDKFLRKDINEGKCSGLNCKNETKYNGLKMGYSRYCSNYCSSNDPKIIQKNKETCLSNNGVKSPMHSKKFLEKYNNTCLKKYGVKWSFQSKEVKELTKKTFLLKYGVDHFFKTKQGKQILRIKAIKEVEDHKLNNEPLFPNTGFRERESLNDFQKFTILKIIRNDHDVAIVVGRFPDGHIIEIRLLINFDERAHFLDKECKIYKEIDNEVTLQLASYGCIVWRVSELEWKNNKEKVIEQFKNLVQILTEEYYQ